MFGPLGDCCATQRCSSRGSTAHRHAMDAPHCPISTSLRLPVGVGGKGPDPAGRRATALAAHGTVRRCPLPGTGCRRRCRFVASRCCVAAPLLSAPSVSFRTAHKARWGTSLRPAMPMPGSTSVPCSIPARHCPLQACAFPRDRPERDPR